MLCGIEHHEADILIKEAKEETRAKAMEAMLEELDVMCGVDLLRIHDDFEQIVSRCGLDYKFTDFVKETL